MIRFQTNFHKMNISFFTYYLYTCIIAFPFVSREYFPFSLCATIFTIITCRVRVWRPISLLLIEFLQIQCWRVPLKFIEPNETLFKSRSNNWDASLVFVRCILFIVYREKGKIIFGVKKKKRKICKSILKSNSFFFHFYRKFPISLHLFLLFVIYKLILE